MKPTTENKQTANKRFKNYYELCEERKRRLIGRLVTLPIQTYFRDSDAIPFHIPHKRVFCTDADHIEETIETSKSVLPGIGEKLSVNKPYCELKIPQIKPPDGTILTSKSGPENIFGPILKLPAINRNAKKSHTGVCYKCPKLKGRLNFEHIVDVLKNDKSDSYFYLKPAFPKESIHYSPFDYELVDYDDCDIKDYYTLSRDGIMHHVKGVATFWPLKQLERAYKKFNYMRKIDLFKKILCIKIFKQWKKYIGLRKVHLRVAYLDEIFLFKNEELRNVIFDVQSLCFSFSRLTFFDDSIIEKLTLEDFYNRQLTRNEVIMDKITEARSLFKKMIELACYSDLKSAGFTTDDIEPKISAGTSRKSKSLLVKSHGSNLMPVIEHYKKKQECIIISKISLGLLLKYSNQLLRL